MSGKDIPLLVAVHVILWHNQTASLDPPNQQPRLHHPSVQSNSANRVSKSFDRLRPLPVSNIPHFRRTYVELVVFKFDGGYFEAESWADIMKRVC